MATLDLARCERHRRGLYLVRPDDLEVWPSFLAGVLRATSLGPIRQSRITTCSAILVLFAHHLRRDGAMDAHDFGPPYF